MATQRQQQLIVFGLGDSEFAFPVEDMQEIVRPGQFTRVPLTPEYILGLSNLRGQILTVIDLRRRLGLEPKEIDDHSRLLVLNLASGKVCFLVDEVREVRFFSEDELEPAPNTGEEIERFVKEVAKAEQGEKMVLILDSEKLVSHSWQETTSLQRASRVLESTAENPEENKVCEKRFLSFRLGQEEYAFPIEGVREIIRYREIKEFPEAPAYMKGMITLRNQILPIFDLRALLGLPSLVEETKRRIQHLARFFEHLLKEIEDFRPELGAPETCLLGAWIKERLETSRSEEEYTLLARLERLHHQFHESISAGKEAWSPLAEKIFELLESLEGVAEKSSMEEQRILVLEERGRAFGLLVDRVEEVVNVPEEKIDSAPPEEDLAAIIKLEEGRRLIFVLKHHKILPQKDLEEYVQQGGPEMNEEKDLQESEELQLVTFNLGDEEYGIPIVQIQEINRLGLITRVPNTPDFVEGVTNLRGEVIPVIDLRKRFGIRAREQDDRTRLVIVQINGKKTAFIVDWVNEVARFSKKNIESPPGMLEAEVDLHFISGIAKAGEERMILILDVEKILSPEEKRALNEMASSAEPKGEEVSEELFQIAE